MPRIVLAGGLDWEREAFAAELADLWNDVPLECIPYHNHVPVLTPDVAQEFPDLKTIDWIVQGSYFTTRQAQVAQHASHVVFLSFHSPEKMGEGQYKLMLKGRDRIYTAANLGRASQHSIFDNPQRIVSGFTATGTEWNALSQMGAFIRSQRNVDYRIYLAKLTQTAWEAQK